MSDYKKVKDYMTRNVSTVDPDMPIEEIKRIIKTTGHDGFPVEKDGQIVGIITEKDMALKIASAKYEDVPLSHMRISTIMTDNVITADISESKVQVLKKMVENHIGGIPIMDGDKIVGMVTMEDILEEIVSDIAEPTTHKRRKA